VSVRKKRLGELAELLAARTELPARRIPGLPQEWPLLLYGRYEIRCCRLDCLPVDR
jgi:hypothetical protein